MDGLVALVDLFLVGTYRYCDRPHASFPEYTQRLLSAPLVTVKTPDLTYSLPADRTIEIVISNFDLGTQTPDAPSISAILKAEKPTGKVLRVRYYDPTLATVILQVDATIVEVADVNQKQARLVAQEVDSDAMQKTLSIRVLDRFPSADLATTVTEDPVEIIPFGTMRRVDLTLCHRGILVVAYTFPNTLPDNLRFDSMTNLTPYQIQPGNYLYYDVLWDTATSGLSIGLGTTDGVVVGNNGEVDQNGISAFSGTNFWAQMSVPYQRWYRRKIMLLDAHVGKTINGYFLAARGSAAGTYSGYFSNAFIGDTFGNVLKYIVTPETGQPTLAIFATADAANGPPVVTYVPAFDYGPIRPAFGGALTFAGTGLVTVANPDQFPVGTGCTFEGFLNTSSVSVTVGGRRFATGQSWFVFISNTGHLSMNIASSGSNLQAVVTAAPANTGTWHWFALVINNVTKIARLYLDNLAPVLLPYVGTFSDTGGTFTFGGVPAQVPFVGSLDDIRFWGRNRPLAELQTVNNRTMPLTGTESGLYGYWPFDELVVTPSAQVRDWTGRGNHGAITNATPLPVALLYSRIVTVYRDGRVADEVDWGNAAFISQFVRFTKEQRDINGRLMRIQADLFSLEFDQNFAAAEKFVLADAGFGLDLPVAPAAFQTAVQAYRTAGYTIGHGLFQAVTAGEVLRYMHVRGAYLRRNAAGEYEEIVDDAALHTGTPASLGQADGYWENCEIRTQRLLSLSQRIRKLTLQGVFDRGFSGGGSYLVNTERSRVDKGREETLKNAFLGDTQTVDRECDYLFKALVSLDSQIEVQALSEFVGQEVRKLTSVFSPNMDFSGDQYQLLQWQLQGPILLILLGQWDPLLLTYAAGKMTADARAASIVDFSATFPGVPTGVGVVADGTRTGSNGAAVEAFLLATATMPGSNGTHLVFRVFQPGSQVPQQEILVAAAAGETKSARFGLPPGLIFDVHTLVRNVDNPLLFRDGTVVISSSILTPGDTSIPGAPTGIVLRQSGTKEVEIVVVFTEPADWGVLELFRNTVNAVGGQHLESKKGKTFHDQSVGYGEIWYYSARARDMTGNLSGFSPVSSISIGRLGSNDYGVETINGFHLQAAIINGFHLQVDIIDQANMKVNSVGTLNLQVLSVGTLNLIGDAVTTAKRQQVLTLTASYSLPGNQHQQFLFTHSLGRIPLVTVDTNSIGIHGAVYLLTSTNISVDLKNVNATGTGTIAGVVEVFFW